jgi:hypothetical protein
VTVGSIIFRFIAFILCYFSGADMFVASFFLLSQLLCLYGMALHFIFQMSFRRKGLSDETIVAKLCETDEDGDGLDDISIDEEEEEEEDVEETEEVYEVVSEELQVNSLFRSVVHFDVTFSVRSGVLVDP